MKEKRGLKEILKSKPVIGAIIFIVVSLAFAFAGNIVVKEGSMDVNGSLNTTGAGTFDTVTATGEYLRVGSSATNGLYFERKFDAGSGVYNGEIYLIETGIKYARWFFDNANTGNVFFDNRMSGKYIFQYLGNTKFTISSSGDITPARHIYQADNSKHYFGTGNNASIYYDGTNMIFGSNETGNGIAWFSGNVSAQGYIDRTSVYDKSKGTALSYAKDSDEYKTPAGEINHSKFYGHISYPVTDFEKPETRIVCKNITLEDGNQQESCSEEVYYPYTKQEEGVSISDELALLRQAVFELKQQNTLLKTELSEICLKDKSYSWC